MNSKQLQYFLTTIEQGSIASAARVLGIAQPAVSLQIANLEHELKVNLFVRDYKGVKLTDAGTIFKTHAQQLTHKIALAKQDVTQSKNVLSGNIRIGMCQAICNVLAQPLIEAAHKLAPQVNVNISTGPSYAVRDWLANKQVDVVISYQEDIALKNIQSNILLEESLFLTMSKDRCKPQDKQLLEMNTVSFSRLAQIELIKPNMQDALASVIEQYQKKFKVTLNYAVPYPGQLLTALRYVIEGQGMMILPSSAFYHLELKRKLHAIKIVKPEVSRSVVVATATSDERSKALEFIIDLIQQQARALQQQKLWR